MPLLRASLKDLSNGTICLNIAEWQSIASKIWKNLRSNKERTSYPQKTLIGKKPNVMLMKKCDDKIFEIAYVESSRIICINSKKDDDSVKLWRKIQNGISFVNIACRLLSNQFGIIGIQVTSKKVYLNVLVKDANRIPRYFHLN